MWSDIFEGFANYRSFMNQVRAKSLSNMELSVGLFLNQNHFNLHRYRTSSSRQSIDFPPAAELGALAVRENNESLGKRFNFALQNKLIAKIDDVGREKKHFELCWEAARKSRQTSKNYKSLHSNNTLMDSGWEFCRLLRHAWCSSRLPLWEIKMSTFWASENGKQIEPSSFWDLHSRKQQNELTFWWSGKKVSFFIFLLIR